MKHVCRFENEGSPDDLYKFLNDLLVDLKFGPVGIPSLTLFGSGDDIVGAVYDDVMETVMLVSSEHESLLEGDD